MWLLVVAMLLILVLAGLVVLYVAFPHRGEDVPHVPWLGRVLRRGVDNAPTLHNTGEVEAEVGTSAPTLDLTDLGRPEARSRHRRGA